MNPEVPHLSQNETGGAPPVPSNGMGIQLPAGSLSGHAAGNETIAMSFLDHTVPDAVLLITGLVAPFFLMWLAVQVC